MTRIVGLITLAAGGFTAHTVFAVVFMALGTGIDMAVGTAIGPHIIIVVNAFFARQFFEPLFEFGRVTVRLTSDVQVRVDHFMN